MNDLSLRTLQLRIQALSSGETGDTEHAAIAQLTVDPRGVLRALLSIIVVLAVASTAAGAALYFFRWPEESFGYRMVKLFWLDTEHNIPTIYQCSVMLAASVLFILLGHRCRRAGATSAAAWYALAFVFTFLAIDEGAQIHEAIGEAIGAAYGTSYGASWLFFYVPIALIVLACLVPSLLRLPARIRRLLILSGALYVGGSVGIEAIGQAYAASFGRTNAVYAVAATTEEVLEMLGVALLIFTLLEHLRTLDQPHGPAMGWPPVS